YKGAMRLRRLGLVSSFVGLVVACAGGASQGPDPAAPSSIVQAPTAPSGDVAAPSTPSAPDPRASLNATEPPTPDAGPLYASAPAGGRICGCQLCDAVVSNDSCGADADCAPETPCHATRCVAKAKAKPRKDVMCTEIMLCNTVDANACGCVKGKCTLHAR